MKLFQISMLFDNISRRANYIIIALIVIFVIWVVLNQHHLMGQLIELKDYATDSAAGLLSAAESAMHLDNKHGPDMYDKGTDASLKRSARVYSKDRNFDPAEKSHPLTYADGHESEIYRTYGYPHDVHRRFPAYFGSTGELNNAYDHTATRQGHIRDATDNFGLNYGITEQHSSEQDSSLYFVDGDDDHEHYMKHHM